MTGFRGFRFLVSGCTKVDFVVRGEFRGFRFLGRPARHGNSPIDLVCKVIGGVFMDNYRFRSAT